MAMEHQKKAQPHMAFHSPVGASTSTNVWQKLAR